jgi:Zn-finger protein
LPMNPRFFRFCFCLFYKVFLSKICRFVSFFVMKFVMAKCLNCLIFYVEKIYFIYNFTLLSMRLPIKSLSNRHILLLY